MKRPSELQLDALKEIVNTGVGKAAASLNEMLDSHILLDVPSITLFHPEDPDSGLHDFTGTEISCVQLNFRGTLTGTAALVFPPQSAIELVAALTGEDPEAPCLNAVMAGTLNEVGNIVINGVIGTLGNILAKPFEFSVPNYFEGKLEELLKLGDAASDLTVLLIRTSFRVQERQVEGNIFMIFELGSFDALFCAIEGLCPPC